MRVALAGLLGSGCDEPADDTLFQPQEIRMNETPSKKPPIQPDADPEGMLLKFRKERAEYLLDCLKNGKPLEPGPEGRWDSCTATETAAALFRLATAVRRRDGRRCDMHDIIAGLVIYAGLLNKVVDGLYDAEYDPEALAIVSDPRNRGKKGPIEQDITWISGKKGSPPRRWSSGNGP